MKLEVKLQPDRSLLPESEKEKPLPADFIDTTENYDFNAPSHLKLIDLKERLRGCLIIQNRSYNWIMSNVNFKIYTVNFSEIRVHFSYGTSHSMYEIKCIIHLCLKLHFRYLMA